VVALSGMNDLLQQISNYGYVGLFAALMFGIVGLPIPDETLLTFCGYLVSRGTLHALFTWLTALGGSLSGITASYLLGRYAGANVVHRFGRYIHVTEKDLQRVEQWFERVGHWLLTIGYYIPGVRHFTALVAGTSGMPYHCFAMYAYPGAALWVSTFLGVGYIFGDQWERMADILHHGSIALAVALAGAVIGYLFWRRMKKKSDSN
jgi:membrane protein DedA with SNARE-associated domain